MWGHVRDTNKIRQCNPRVHANFLIWRLSFAFGFMTPRVSPASEQNVAQRKQALTVSLLEDLVQAAGAGHTCEGQSTDSSSYVLPPSLPSQLSFEWKRMKRMDVTPLSSPRRGSSSPAPNR